MVSFLQVFRSRGYLRLRSLLSVCPGRQGNIRLLCSPVLLLQASQQFLLLCRQAVDHLFPAVAVLSQPMQQHCMRHFMRHSMFHLNSSFDKACKKAALLCPLADEGGFISSAVPLHDLSLLPFNAGDTSLYTGAVFCAFQRAADRCIQKVAYP